MTKNDIILAVLLGVFSIGSFFGLIYMQTQSAIDDGIAVIIYQSEEIARIDLAREELLELREDYTLCTDLSEETTKLRCMVIDEANNTYTVFGLNGPVVMKVENHAIRVIDEISPQNICQLQGWTNSPLKALTCLPNDLIIRIEAPFDEDDDDIIIQ